VAVTKVTGRPALPVTFETIGIAPPVVYATLNGTPAANTTLSNGNLTATHTDSSGNAGARSTAYKSTGKLYFEAVYVVVTGAQSNVGVGTSVGSYSNLISGTSSAVSMCNRGSGTIFSLGVNTGKTLAGLLVADVVCWAVDAGGLLAWVRRVRSGSAGDWNGDPTANPATGVGGITLGAGSYAPMVGFGGASTGPTEVITANFGASAFSGTVPSGFISGWPA
jgi:hypothetical protein